VTARWERVARRAVVRGVVQGVGFRVSTRAQALRRGVTGWARNRADGTVEVHLEGAPEDVEAVLGWLRTGPRHARVSAVEVNAQPVEGHDGFELG